ncbi:MAG TPA: Na-translocating system protein MpsC family protein [Thermoleophilaceae bacterium]|nr:Na-translocating system protein MpsC family protein [Thermoleophilaceae bacterium]
MTSPDQMEAGPRAAAISNAIVQLLHEYTGRGPTHARTTIAGDLIVCLLADTLTKSERKLVEAGEERLVLEERSTFQRLMRVKAIAEIERLSGRTVTAFMSTNHIDPDLAVETFVLAPSPAGASANSEVRRDGWPA